MTQISMIGYDFYISENPSYQRYLRSINYLTF
jgi:hypothetical protein